nr:immunoglobulin light chain junction region [Homo sapiens]
DEADYYCLSADSS